MPVDFSILQRAPDIGAQFMAGQQQARERALQNRLLARQDLEFQQAQENRARALEKERRKQQYIERAAELLRTKYGKDPDDPAVAQEMLALGTETENPQLVALGRAMTERAAKRREAAAETEAVRAAMRGPVAPAGAPAAAAPAAMTQPPAAPAITATTFDEGAVRPVQPPLGIGAQAMGVAPQMPMGPVRELPPVEQRTGRNALATPVAPVNAMVAPPAQAAAPTASPAAALGVAQMEEELERLQTRYDRVAALGTEPARKQAALLKPELDRLARRIEKLRGPAPTANEREYQLAKQQGFTGSFMEYKQAIQPKPAQLSVKLPEQEKAERGERGKLLVEQYRDVSKAAGLAVRTLPALDVQERILNSGFETGFGTEAQKAAASVLGRLGVPEAEKYATDAQTFLAATQQAVLQRQLEQKGPQTEADAQRITQTGAQLGNTTDANRFIIAVAKAQLKRDIEQRNFYDSWWKKNKTYDGAEDAWFSGAGSKSLFEDPVLKNFAPAATPATGRGRVGGGAADAPEVKGRSIRDQADAIISGG